MAALLPNRGPVASTSAAGRTHEPPLAGASRGRAAVRSRAVAGRRQTVPKEEEGAWETVWVSGNGSQIPLPEAAELPAEAPAEAAAPAKKIPAEMRYFDTARIYLKAGDGGNGCVAFRREKFVPRGGPAGGNGGNGGHVWAVVDPALNSLTSFRKQLHYRAGPGTNGSGSRRHGASGRDVEVSVPRGTIIRRKEAGEGEPALAELLQPGSRALLATGGRGGRGNASFKTGSNNAPQMAESGAVGEEAWVDLELKLVADVGIIGVPNAGKSTLLGVVSAARPKIAAYPFTTLVPNLGVCELDFRTTVFADIPGLLEGAHAGVGLGHEFLRHCQRARVLVHIIDGTSPDPIGDYVAIRGELELFNPALLDKPQVVAYNKMDLPDSSDYWDEVQAFLRGRGVAAGDVLAISAATGQGVRELVRRLRAVLDELPPLDDMELSTDALNLTAPAVGRSDQRIDEFSITAELAEGRVFHVEGAAIERFTQMTNWNYYEALLRFQKVLDASGISRALREKGIREGDSVVIGEAEMEWSEDQSEGAIYGKWLEDRKAQGKPLKGTTSWPYAG